MQTSFWDMNPSSPSNGAPIVAESSENAPQTDGSPICTCGKEMSGCSIHPTIRDEWIASMQASLVLILAALEIKPGSAKAREADFTEKCSELLTRFDPDTSSWKTSQQSLLTNGSEPFSETWPRAGMMHGGRVYRHLQPVPRTTVIGGGALQNVPTPNACKAANDVALKRSGDGRQKPNKLGWWVAMWPTPSATDYKGSVTQSLVMERLEHPRGVRLPEELVRRGETGGQLNPDWTEWLMGFPIGHTALKPLATPKSRCKPQSHGDSWEAHEHRP